MSTLPGVELGRLAPEQIPLASGVAARAMRDNPSTRSLYGDDPVLRMRACEPLYQWVLEWIRQPVLIATRRGAIVGLAAMAPPERCFFRQIAERERTLSVAGRRVRVAIPYVPSYLLLPLLRQGPKSLARVSKWGEAGLAHDPQELHQHVEMLAVEPALQGLGIGHLMMAELCQEMDTVAAITHLETDTAENVKFYEEYGFAVTEEASVLGVRNWYMQRKQGGV